MKAKKLLSIAIASLLLCGCIVGMLVTGASAAPGTYEVGEGKTYATVEAALAQIKTDAEAGTIDSAIITINGMANATVDADNIMFGVETIWLNKAEAKKLPITITGTPNETVAPAEGVDINADGINFPADKTTGVFTNDYSFEGIKIHYLKSAASARVTFHAGSGAVTLKDVTMTTIGTNLGKSGYYLYADNNTAAAYKGWDGVQPVDGIINTSCLTLDGVTIPATSGKFNGVGAAGGFAGEYAAINGINVTAGQTQAKLVIKGNGISGTMANVTYGAINTSLVAKAIVEIDTNETATAIPFIVGVSGVAGDTVEVDIDLEYNIKGGKIVAATFSSHGTDVTRVINNAGNVTVNISGGTFEGNCSLTTAGTVTGTVTNNISGGTFMMKYAAGGAGEGCAKNIVNNISGGNFVSDTFFGNESTEATSVTTNLNKGTIALGNTTAITATALNGKVVVKEITDEDFIPTSVYVTVPTAGIASGATIKAAEDAAYGLIASVDGANTVWTAVEWSQVPPPVATETTYEVGQGKAYATVEAALAQIKEDVAEGTSNAATITINGMVNATVDADNIMFGVETIWLNKAEAKKLPITIIGTPNETVAPAEGVDINADGINFPADKTTGVFTNDYSFEGIKIHYLKSAASARVTFHAGSGAVTLKDVTMTTIGTNLGKSGYYLYADNNTAAAYKGWDGVQPVDGIINTSCFVLDGVTIPATSGKFNGVGAASGFAGEYATVDGVSVTAGQTQAKLVIQGNGLIGTQANVTYNAGNGTRVAKAILEINTNDTATAIPFIVGVSGTADTALDVNIPLEYNIKGGKIVAATFSSHGTDESRVINNAGNVTVNISGGTFEGNCSLTTAGTVTGTVTNNISGGTFMMKYAAGGAGEGCAKNIVNNISGGTFVSDTFFGNESTEATSVTTTLNEGTIALGNTTAITATAVNGTVIVKEIAEEDFIPTSVYVTVPTAGIASGATIKAAEDAAYGLLASVDGENTVWTAAEWSTIPVPTPPPAGEGGEGTGNEGGAGTGNEGNAGAGTGNEGGAGAGTGNEGGAGAGTGNEGGSNLGTGTSPTTSNNSMLFAWIALAVVSMTGVVVLRKRTSL